MAVKIGSMPPDDAVKIILEWPDYDIIDVLRQMDKTAQQNDQASIVAFLITLIDKAEPGRGGALTQKMMENPKLVVAPGS